MSTDSIITEVAASQLTLYLEGSDPNFVMLNFNSMQFYHFIELPFWVDSLSAVLDKIPPTPFFFFFCVCFCLRASYVWVNKSPIMYALNRKFPLLARGYVHESAELVK